MRIKLIATAVVAVLSSAALAQTGPSSGGAGDNDSGGGGGLGDRSGAPADWSGTIGNTFFSGTHHTKLRSRSAIKRNWAKLSSEQQQQVRSDCQNMASNNSSSELGAESTVPNSTSKGGPTAKKSATAQPSAADMNQVCRVVQAM